MGVFYLFDFDVCLCLVDWLCNTIVEFYKMFVTELVELNFLYHLKIFISIINIQVKLK